MPLRNELERLADARPTLLDHSEYVVTANREDQILLRILSTARPSPARLRYPMARGRLPRLAAGLAAVAAVAAVATVGAVVTSGPSGRPARPAPAAAISVETVASQTLAAATRASGSGVLHTRTVFADRTAGATAVIETWELGITVREQTYDAAAHLAYDASATVVNGKRIRRFVDYTSRTWTADSVAAAKYSPGPKVASWFEQFFRSRPASVQPTTAVTTGAPVITAMTVSGGRLLRATGQWPAATGAVRPWPLPALAQAMYTPNTATRGPLTESVWIDAVTYLPVAITVASADGIVLAQQTFDWLPADTSNLAELIAAPVPAGFACTQPVAFGPNPYCPLG